MMGASILGIKELTDKLKKLDVSLSKKVGVKMVAAAGQVVKKEAKRIAQQKGLRKTGALINNIAIKREPKVPANTIQYNVGVRHGRNLSKARKQNKYLGIGRSGRVVTKYKNDPFYWRFLELGTKNIKPTKFLEPALVNKKQQAIDAMGNALDKEMLKAKL